MRERLIELLLRKSCMTNKCPDIPCDECECIAVHTGDADKIADYLLANGVIIPPCKVGDKVYTEVLNRIESFVITNFEFSVTPNGWSCGVTSSNGLYPMLFSFDSIGKTVFLTKESAENALKERERE